MVEFIKELLSNWQGIVAAFFAALGALALFLVALIKLFALIPGDQPEKFLQKVVDFIAKYSNK